MKAHCIEMDDLEKLTKKFKINKTWLALTCGLSYHAFLYALERGLRESEVAAIEKALNSLSEELRDFRIPSKYLKKTIDLDQL